MIVSGLLLCFGYQRVFVNVENAPNLVIIRIFIFQLHGPLNQFFRRRACLAVALLSCLVDPVSDSTNRQKLFFHGTQLFIGQLLAIACDVKDIERLVRLGVYEHDLNVATCF